MNKPYNPIFTYIIPFRSSPDRIIPLRKSLDWINGFHGVEVIIVEQDKTPKLSELSLKAKVIFTKSDLPFNKSWAMNVGLSLASSEFVVFGDADFIMDPNNLIESLKNLQNIDCVIPTNNNIKLDVMESLLDFQSILKINRKNPKKTLVDGIIAFKKDSIFNIGGWNEDFFGKNFYNKFQEDKIKLLLNYKQMDFNGYQFYHNPIGNNPDLDYRDNSIYNMLKTTDVSNLKQHIYHVLPKIGQKNKLVL